MSRARTELQQLTIDGGYEVVATMDKQPTWGGCRKGAGRPKTSANSHSVTIRLTKYDYHRLQDVAEIRSETVTAAALHALRSYLNEMIEEPEPPEEDPIM